MITLLKHGYEETTKSLILESERWFLLWLCDLLAFCPRRKYLTSPCPFLGLENRTIKADKSEEDLVSSCMQILERRAYLAWSEYSIDVSFD